MRQMAAPSRDSSPKVLVVDPDAHLARRMCDELRRLGLDPSEATSEERAIEECRRTRFDVVVVEPQLRGTPGPGFVARLRMHLQRANLVLYSAIDQADLESHGFSAHCDRILAKANHETADAARRITDLQRRARGAGGVRAVGGGESARVAHSERSRGTVRIAPRPAGSVRQESNVLAGHGGRQRCAAEVKPNGRSD